MKFAQIRFRTIYF